MYESPISLSTMAEEISRKIIDEQDNYIVETCFKMGVNVDKDELVKALAYDREQYRKGFADGRQARDDDIVRCKDCKYHQWFIRYHYKNGIEFEAHECHRFTPVMDVTPDWFCAGGERRDDD